MLLWGVMARDGTGDVGETFRPGLRAALQSAYPRAPATTSWLPIESQQTGEAAAWVESTGVVGKVPFCFMVIRAHLYFREPAVLVYGDMLATYGATLPVVGAPAEVHGVPTGVAAPTALNCS